MGADDFEIDVVLTPDVAPGVAAFTQALDGLVTRSKTANQQVHAAVAQLGKDLVHKLAAETTEATALIQRALTGIESKAASTAHSIRSKLDAAASAQSAAFANARSAIGPGPAFGELGVDSIVGTGDMFEGWKKGATGASKATQALDQATSALGVNLVRLGAVGAAAFAAKKVVDYADAYTNLQNRLSTVTEGSDELASVTAKLFDVANETRSGFVATGEFYTRLAANTKDLGLSQSDLLGVTETLQKAFKISGSTAAESSAAMLQLSQGLASGTLRGEELNSVLEQAPMIGHAIADSMGIAYGSLREVASQGGITAENVVDAVQAMQGEVDEKFAKTAPTFADLWTKLENQLVRFGGKIGPALAPVIEAVGSIIDIAGAALNALGPAFEFLGSRLAMMLEIIRPIGEALKELIGFVGDLFSVAKSAFDAVEGAVDAVGDKIQDVLGGSIGEDAIAAAKRFEQLRDSIADSLGDKLVQGLKNTQNAINATAFAMGNFAAITADARIKQIVSDFETLGELRRSIDPTIEASKKFEAATRALSQQLKEGKISVVDFSTEIGALKAEVFGTADALQAAEDAIARVNKVVSDEQAKAAKAAAEAFKKLKADVRALVEELDPAAKATRELAEAENILERAVARGLLTQKQANEVLAAKRELLSDVLDVSSGMLAVENEAARTFERNRQIWNVEKSGGLTLGGATSNPELEAFDLNAKLAAKSIEQLADARQRALDTYNASQWNAEIESLRQINLQAEAISKGFDLATDAISEFVETGTVDFRKLISSMIAELTKLALQKGLLQLLDFGGLTSTAPTLGGPSPGFATGGSFVVGGDGGVDTTPVYFRATRGERVTVETPAQQTVRDEGPQGVGGGGVLVQNQFDPESFFAVLDTPRAERKVVNIMAKHAATIHRQGR